VTRDPGFFSSSLCLQGEAHARQHGKQQLFLNASSPHFLHLHSCVAARLHLAPLFASLLSSGHFAINSCAQPCSSSVSNFSTSILTTTLSSRSPSISSSLQVLSLSHSQLLYPQRKNVPIRASLSHSRTFPLKKRSHQSRPISRLGDRRPSTSSEAQPRRSLLRLSPASIHPLFPSAIA